ncbi:MAG: hypothetical protein AAB215_07985 [Planctomycetota bacterium]
MPYAGDDCEAQAARIREVLLGQVREDLQAGLRSIIASSWKAGIPEGIRWDVRGNLEPHRDADGRVGIDAAGFDSFTVSVREEDVPALCRTVLAATVYDRIARRNQPHEDELRAKEEALAAARTRTEESRNRLDALRERQADHERLIAECVAQLKETEELLAVSGDLVGSLERKIGEIQSDGEEVRESIVELDSQVEGMTADMERLSSEFKTEGAKKVRQENIRERHLEQIPLLEEQAKVKQGLFDESLRESNAIPPAPANAPESTEAAEKRMKVEAASKDLAAARAELEQERKTAERCIQAIGRHQAQIEKLQRDIFSIGAERESLSGQRAMLAEQGKELDSECSLKEGERAFARSEQERLKEELAQLIRKREKETRRFGPDDGQPESLLWEAETALKDAQAKRDEALARRDASGVALLQLEQDLAVVQANGDQEGLRSLAGRHGFDYEAEWKAAESNVRNALALEYSISGKRHPHPVAAAGTVPAPGGSGIIVGGIAVTVLIFALFALLRSPPEKSRIAPSNNPIIEKPRSKKAPEVREMMPPLPSDFKTDGLYFWFVPADDGMGLDFNEKKIGDELAGCKIISFAYVDHNNNHFIAENPSKLRTVKLSPKNLNVGKVKMQVIKDGRDIEFIFPVTNPWAEKAPQGGPANKAGPTDEHRERR